MNICYDSGVKCRSENIKVLGFYCNQTIHSQSAEKNKMHIKLKLKKKV